MRVIVAMDVGATWTRAEVYVDGRVMSSVKVETPRSSDGVLISSYFLNIIKKILGDYRDDLSAVGIAIFGPINYREGIVVNPVNHPAREIPVRSVIESELWVPVILVNDAVAGAWSGFYYTGIHDLVYVALGTGVGVGVIVSGRLLLGRRGDSHEAGHIVLDYKSEAICGCGGKGHWEALFSGARLREGRVRGDPHRIVAAGIGSLLSCYDPELVLLGGGLVENNVIDINKIRFLVREYSFLGRSVRIERHPLGDRANLYGAYLLAYKPTEEILRLNGW